MNSTSDKTMSVQEEIQFLIENLLRIATRHKVVICGFAFAAETPMITNFGNCNDYQDVKLYEKLVEVCKAKREQGKAINTTIGEVN